MNAEFVTLTLPHADIQKANEEFYGQLRFRFQLDGNDKSKGEKQHDNENKGHEFKLTGFSLLAKKEQ